jgi:hypothetical protein
MIKGGKMGKLHVYISGPLYAHGTEGANVNVVTNIRNAIFVAEEFRAAGCAPYVPHLTHYWATITGDKPREWWMALDKDWLAKCDFLVRLPGPSRGSDEEGVEARRLGIRVFDWEPDSAIEIVAAAVVAQVVGIE